MMKACSILSQLLQLFPRLTRQTQAEQHARGLTYWGQLVAMLFCRPGWRMRSGRSVGVWPVVRAS